MQLQHNAQCTMSSIDRDVSSMDRDVSSTDRDVSSMDRERAPDISNSNSTQCKLAKCPKCP